MNNTKIISISCCSTATCIIWWWSWLAAAISATSSEPSATAASRSIARDSSPVSSYRPSPICTTWESFTGKWNSNQTFINLRSRARPLGPSSRAESSQLLETKFAHKFVSASMHITTATLTVVLGENTWNRLLRNCAHKLCSLRGNLIALRTLARVSYRK